VRVQSDIALTGVRPVLELADVHKQFGGVPALRGARLDVSPGEIHALVGENGAGKSTLINIATGLFRPDSGRIVLGGREISLTGPRHAAGLGIAVVHQESDLFPQLSIAENMLLARGLVRGPMGLINWPATTRKAEQLVANMGEEFDVRGLAGGLSVARRMMAEISAAVSEQAQVLFLDEPTASLTLKEIDHLFAQIRRLRDAGVGIVYVSHRLEEILELCDRVTIMRDGETVETLPVAGLSMERIVSSMVGRERNQMFVKRAVPIGATRFEVQGVTDADGRFSDISFDVRAGEILGMYGFVGAGRSEFAQAIFGLTKPASGTVRLDGKALRLRSPRDAVRAGIAYLPEDRLVQGIFRSHSLQTNASVAVLRRLSRFGWIRSDKEQDLAQRIVADMHVRASGVDQTIGALSGGNQQKVVFGRWQATQPKVLFLDEPTRGVDVGAKADIHKLVCDMAEKGAAVVMISSELPEIMAMSDRVITLSEGRVTGVFDPKRDSQEDIARAAVPRAAGEASRATKRTVGAFDKVLRFREVGLLAFVTILWGIMAMLKPAEFATQSNFFGVLTNASLPAIMAMGAMLIICAGGIDISVGAMMGLVGAAAAMAAKGGAPPLACLGMALAMGAGCSLLNAGTSLLARIHPIIVTLAGISIYRGLMRILTGGKEVLQLPDAYRALANGEIFGIPKVCYYVIAVTALVHVLLQYALPGRRVLALGDSESAARLIGLSKARVTSFAFLASGLLVGLTSVLHAGYYAGVQSNAGDGMELKAIAAAVIGGTNIMGGRGSALGTLLGAFLVALLYNILILLEISAYWQNLFVGALILLAVVLDVLLQRLRRAGA